MAPSQPAGSPPSWRLPVPAAFAAGVVQQSGEVGAAWLPALPDLLATLLQDWHLVPDGTVRHGYLGIVVPVRRDAAPCVVEVGRPSAEVDNQAASLSAWDGRGMVGLTADPSRGALLLERLDAAVEACRGWAPTAGDLLVDHDLHFGNVLAGERERGSPSTRAGCAVIPSSRSPRCCSTGSGNPPMSPGDSRDSSRDRSPSASSAVRDRDRCSTPAAQAPATVVAVGDRLLRHRAAVPKERDRPRPALERHDQLPDPVAAPAGARV